jgi:hypothetical protein
VLWSTVPRGLVLALSRPRLESGSLEKSWGHTRFQSFWEKGEWAQSTKRSILGSTELALVIRKLLCKNSTARYESAGAVLEALASPPDQPPRRNAKALTSIAVLPFAFLSEVEGWKALSLGFADALITMLAHLDDIVVAPTSGILKYAPGVEPAQVRVHGELLVRASAALPLPTVRSYGD